MGLLGFQKSKKNHTKSPFSNAQVTVDEIDVGLRLEREKHNISGLGSIFSFVFVQDASYILTIYQSLLTSCTIVLFPLLVLINPKGVIASILYPSWECNLSDARLDIIPHIK